MTIKEKLQIYLITYNRKKKLQETLDIILDCNSPIKDFCITILDNASTDGSSELIAEYCAKYCNLKHVRHNINIGGNANICRAFEMAASCSKDYFWILCDNDKYDFSNWQEVENAIKNDVDIVCVADYIFPNNDAKNNKAYQMFQLTFVPAGIYKTKNIDANVLINMYDSILTMFPQLALVSAIVNSKGDIYVLSKPIVFNGIFFEDKLSSYKLSYTRGMNNSSTLERKVNTTWIVGFRQALTLITDKKLRKDSLSVIIPSEYMYCSWFNFYKYLFSLFIDFSKFNYFIELYLPLSKKCKINFLLCILPLFLKFVLRKTFSITNSIDRKYKIITVLGFEIKYLRR